MGTGTFAQMRWQAREKGYSCRILCAVARHVGGHSQD